MYPARFDYHRPQTVGEAVALLQEHEDAKVLAGGHSLIPMMKLRLAQPAALIDLGQVAELRRLLVTRDGGLLVGAMVTYREVAEDGDARLYGALHDACTLIGDMQVRNRGTVGGNLAHNDPASDMTAVALALDARLELQGPDGQRTVPVEEFLIGVLETSLQPGEIVTSVRFPPTRSGRVGAPGSAYEKFENPASGYAICGVAALVDLADDGTIARCRVAVTGAAEHAQRLRDVEQALEGSAGGAETLAAACERAGTGLSFMGDIHADEEYRAHLTKVLTRRALERALERARG